MSKTKHTIGLTQFVRAGLSTALVLGANGVAFAASDCNWFGNVYRQVAEARDAGYSKSETYMALAKNQAAEQMRDTFLDIVYQVYVPAMKRTTPAEFYTNAVRECISTAATAPNTSK